MSTKTGGMRAAYEAFSQDHKSLLSTEDWGEVEVLLSGLAEGWLFLRVKIGDQTIWSGRIERNGDALELRQDVEYLEKIINPPNPIFEPEAR